MNREILFRGKHIHALPQNEHLDGTWVYGYLCDENYINSPELEGEFLIDPETVCQYTGLTDKNGRKIFEGDIVREELLFEEDSLIHIIQYSDEYKTFTTDIQICGSLDEPLSEFLRSDECEIIGTIFDNPELLKE